MLQSVKSLVFQVVSLDLVEIVFILSSMIEGLLGKSLFFCHVEGIVSLHIV